MSPKNNNTFTSYTCTLNIYSNVNYVLRRSHFYFFTVQIQTWEALLHVNTGLLLFTKIIRVTSEISGMKIINEEEMNDPTMC